MFGHSGNGRGPILDQLSPLAVQPEPRYILVMRDALIDLCRSHTSYTVRHLGLLAACRRFESPEWRRVGSLSGLLSISPSAIGRCVDRLERDGLVRFEPHPDDKRAVVVALTAGGLRFLEGLDR